MSFYLFYRCWLRYDTHFVWALISPVILIILVSNNLCRVYVIICGRVYSIHSFNNKAMFYKVKINNCDHFKAI